MANESLYDLMQRLRRSGNQSLVIGCMIGRVVNNKDPRKLGRVQLEFPWNMQGSHTEAWAMPVYPLNGDVGSDPPDEDSFLLCLFQEGNPNEPFYIGMTRGIPKRDAVRALNSDQDDSLHLALAEAVDRNFKDVRDWMKNHTHRVRVAPPPGQWIASPSGGPVTGGPAYFESQKAAQQVPDLKAVRARRLRVTAVNGEDDAPGGVR